jgi:hypothetical protein
MDVADLFAASTISNQHVFYYWIYYFEYKERVYFGWCPYCKWTHQIQTYHDPVLACAILGGSSLYLFFSFLSFDIIDDWNINNKCSKSCVRYGHAMVFLIFFSLLVCSR